MKRYITITYKHSDAYNNSHRWLQTREIPHINVDDFIDRLEKNRESKGYEKHSREYYDIIMSDEYFFDFDLGRTLWQ